MVASGLPLRNGDKHVNEVALLSLDLRDTMAELEIPHLNNEKFRLRIGFNTGNIEYPYGYSLFHSNDRNLFYTVFF